MLQEKIGMTYDEAMTPVKDYVHHPKVVAMRKSSQTMSSTSQSILWTWEVYSCRRVRRVRVREGLQLRSKRSQQQRSPTRVATRPEVSSCSMVRQQRSARATMFARRASATLR